MLRFNKDLWDEHELVILMKRAVYGPRLPNSTTNDQLTTPVSSLSSTSEASSSSSSSSRGYVVKKLFCNYAFLNNYQIMKFVVQYFLKYI